MGKHRCGLAIPVVSAAEAPAGPLKHGLNGTATRHERSLAPFEIIPVSIETAISAARLRASAGLRLPDASVAATALETGATAWVTHARDFSKLKGLRILNGRIGVQPPATQSFDPANQYPTACPSLRGSDPAM